MPSTVRNLTAVTNMSSIQIAWEEPEFPNGIVTYILSAVGVDLASGTTVFNQSLALNDTEYQIESTQLYSNYTVMVTSRTGGGDGDSVTTSVQTPEGCKWKFTSH